MDRDVANLKDANVIKEILQKKVGSRQHSIIYVLNTKTHRAVNWKFQNLLWWILDVLSQRQPDPIRSSDCVNSVSRWSERVRRNLDEIDKDTL